jgi:hypothetical protein
MICSNPDCGDRIIPPLAREQDGKVFCGTVCLREYNLAQKDKPTENITLTQLQDKLVKAPP